MKKTLIGIAVIVALNIILCIFIFAKECEYAKTNPCSYDYENYLTDSYNGRFEHGYNENES